MLEIKDLCVSYGVREVLGNLSLRLESGRIHALIGPSGCGKSTLLKVLCGIQPPSGGTVLHNGVPVLRAAGAAAGRANAQALTGSSETADGQVGADGPGVRPDREADSLAGPACGGAGASGPQGIFPRIGYVPQNYGLLDWKTVGQNIFLPLHIGNTRLTGLELQEAGCAAEAIIATLGLRDVLARYPREISGGQQQRAALARAFILRPDLLLMDEPFSALDAFTSETSRALFLDLWREQRVTTLLITHNMHEAAALGQTILLMGRGATAAHCPTPGSCRDVTPPYHREESSSAPTCGRILAVLENDSFEGGEPRSGASTDVPPARPTVAHRKTVQESDSVCPEPQAFCEASGLDCRPLREDAREAASRRLLARMSELLREAAGS